MFYESWHWFFKGWIWFDIAVLGLFALLCAHRPVMTAISFFKRKPKKFPEAKRDHKFAVVIAARNEEKVIANLIESIRRQDYPKELIDIYVVADNCSDRTAIEALDAGATVFERFDSKKGKSYALDFAFKKLLSEYADCGHEAYFIFDADNLLARDYMKEMNKSFDSGVKVSTCYRNSKNWGKNWITSCYALGFMAECRFRHGGRKATGSSTFVSGTGFFVAKEIIERDGGWNYGSMTEDIEFSVAMAMQNTKIDYNQDAMIYDEQPDNLKTSWKQRMRWAKGFYQCLRRYSGKLLKDSFGKGNFASYDMFTFLLPQLLLILWLSLTLIVRFTAGAAIWGAEQAALPFLQTAFWQQFLMPLAFAVGGYWVFIWLYGAASAISERKRINSGFWRKARAVFMLPVFTLTYIPIGAIALFKTVTWVPIEHNTGNMKIEDIEKTI
jgi:cellulose synthase/poly-beta-1,6-N-acetylglucosamine synthase-like glycosyltransferase